MTWRYQYVIRGDWPFTVTFEGTSVELVKFNPEVVKWCINTFGNDPKIRVWYTMGHSYNFREKEHAELFLLRWA